MLSDIDYSPVLALGLRPSDGQVSSNGKDIAYNCRQCTSRGEARPDTKRRFYICVDRANPKNFGSYICFRCGFKGKWRRDDLDLSYRIRPRRLEIAAPTRMAEPLKLPDDYGPLSTNRLANDYVLARGISEADVAYYGIGSGESRVIFPDYDAAGDLCYWVGRAYDDRSPKYKNCRAAQAERTKQLYNLGRTQKAGLKVLILCEGPISAIAAGRNAIASYGKHLTEKQVDILRNSCADRIYLALDPDAKRETATLARKLVGYIKDVYLVSMPRGEDPASLGRENFLSCVGSSIKYSSSSAIKFRLGLLN